MKQLEGHYDRPRPPDFLRVEEAAKVLRIGRTTAYALASEFLDTNGASGLPVIRLGKQLRVPRRRLEQMLGGTITWPPGRNVDGTQPAPPAPTASSTPRHGQRRRTSSPTQPVLSFPS
jgi:excisionase family DNA binding protein